LLNSEDPARRVVRLRPPVLEAREVDRVWYAAYGSNMSRARFEFYLTGGRPPGCARGYPGCRDGVLPEASVPVMMAGRVYFALESPAWTGGMAFYDPRAAGVAAGRAYSMSLGQFSDVAAQEMYRAPGGGDFDLARVLSTGRAVLGPGRYETLVYVGDIGERPVLTFTAPWGVGDVAARKPSERYLMILATGLAESHGWLPNAVAEYLADLPGARGAWSAREILSLLEMSDA
jgi:hypothetical protein